MVWPAAIASSAAVVDAAAAAAVACWRAGCCRWLQLLRFRRNQRELILLDRFLKPIAKIFLAEGCEQFLLGLLIFWHTHLSLEVGWFYLTEAHGWKLFNDSSKSSVEGLLRQAGHFVRVCIVVDQLASEGVYNFHLSAPNYPVDAEVRRFRLSA